MFALLLLFGLVASPALQTPAQDPPFTENSLLRLVYNIKLLGQDQIIDYVQKRGVDFTLRESFTKTLSEGEETLAMGDLDKAIDILSKAVAIYPEYTDEHNAYEPLAAAYLKKGDRKAAVDTLKKFMTYSETGFEATLKLAELLKEDGDLAGADRALEAGIYIRPMDLEEHQRFGELLMTEKQYSRAAREYETLITLNAPDRAGTYYNLAEANFNQGNRQDARKNVMKALEIAPSYEPAQALLLKIVR